MSRSTDSKRPSLRRRVTIRRRADLLAMRPYLERLEPLLLLSTVVVTNAGDTAGIGTGSLRAAILELDAGTGGEIDFAIGSGLVTISPATPLPSLTKPIFVNGASQPGFVSAPIVQLAGSQIPAATPNANGLVFAAGSSGSKLTGLVIDSFGNDGVLVDGSSNNTFTNNDIGTDVSGTAAASNLLNGIELNQSNGNTISGNVLSFNGHVDNNSVAHGYGIEIAGSSSNAVADNTIQRNTLSGVLLVHLLVPNGGNPDLDVDSTGNSISGNTISLQGDHGVELTGATGNLVTGNQITGNGGDGILFQDFAALDSHGTFVGDGASTNTIGGLNLIPGFGLGNLISGNSQNGIRFFKLNVNSGQNLIQGNLIGLASDGKSAQANGVNGVLIATADNTIGGNATAGFGNVISGNSVNGVLITGAGSTGNQIFGDRIGLDVTGTFVIPNGNDGVLINLGASNNTIGGKSFGQGNVISGNNANGIEIAGTVITNEGQVSASSNLIINSDIGTDFTGSTTTGTDINSTPLGNSLSGVLITNSSGNTIGGVGIAAEYRNVISGNNVANLSQIGGIRIETPQSTGNLVVGNYIGTDSTGLNALGNLNDGITLISGASYTTIGGTVVGARNVISGNLGYGVALDYFPTANNLVAGNYIGVGADGSTALGNGTNGVGTLGSANNTIGGDAAAGFGNVISNNGLAGVNLAFAESQGNLVAGNLIGTTADGQTARGNFYGVRIEQGASYNTIGGLTTSAGTGLGNVISGNNDAGVLLQSVAINVVAGNLVGLGADGSTLVANQNYGVELNSNAVFNTIGGLTDTPGTGLGNVISGNLAGGVAIHDVSTASNVVQGNLIGTDSTGLSARANGLGVAIYFTSHDNTIGGSAAGAANVISASQITSSPTSNGVGVDLQDGANANLVQGNFIGTDVTGTQPLGNGTDGVGLFYNPTSLVGSGPSNNTVTGNVVAASGVWGVHLSNAGTSNNLFQANFIGTNNSGATGLGNGAGVLIDTGATDNTFGGTTAGQGNVISANHAVGFYIEYLSGDGTSGNLLQGNFIGTNSAGATNLGNFGNGLAIGGAQKNTIGGSALGAGNVISGNSSDNVDIYGALADGNVLQGNLIGLDPSGMFALPNPSLGFARGVYIGDGTSGFNPSVPGTPTHTTVAGNVISGNTGEGLRIDGGDYSVTTLTITGNKVGTNALGTAAVPNAFSGIVVFTAHDITIGGTTAADRNILSGNSGSGVQIVGSATTGIAVQGNTIGLAADGVTPLGNTSQGVELFFKTHGNLIGGTAAGAGNVISANLLDGILISDAATTANLVQGNFIGTDATGLIASLAGPDGMPGTADDVHLGNGRHGVFINFSPGNTIGGTTAGLNVISGNSNGSGVEITDSASTHNLVAGNYIGLDANGTAGFKFFDGVGNPTRFFGTGVDLGNNASQNTIGGTTDATRNVISGNDHGVVLGDTSSNLIEGNYIGPDKTGLVNVGQAFHDVRIGGGVVDNTIGGTAAGAGNVIAGAGRESIYADSPTSTGNVIQGNKIGTNKDGTAALGNMSDGIHLGVGSNHFTIGGTAPGAGNLISGNAGSGLSMDAGYGQSTHDNVVQGNTIGLGSTGATLANGGHGVFVDHSYNNLIGGAAAGARNVISGNSLEGVSIGGADVPGQPAVLAATGNVVAGNFIGTSLDGKSARPNGYSGVLLASGANHNTVGGDSKAGLGNVISGNAFEGVTITDAGTSQNLVEGNLIGTTADGKTALGNTASGVSLSNAATSNSIGGDSKAGLGNVISGNGQSGVGISGVGTSGNVVAGNLIGTDAAGSSALHNVGSGVDLDHASGNTVGGTASGTRNILSGNKRGVALFGDFGTGASPTTGNVVEGNYIGTNVTGSTTTGLDGQPLGNGDGVVLIGNASNNTIGGTTAAARNIVSGSVRGSGSSGDGIFIEIASSNLIQGNFIGTNATGDLSLGNAGVGVDLNVGGGANNTIGGLTSTPGQAPGNVIVGSGTGTGTSPFGSSNIVVSGSGSTGNLVAGNLIGLLANGTAAPNNTRHGLSLTGGASGNTIGGAAAGARNIISGNAQNGVNIIGTGTTSNAVLGNFIGTDLTGTMAIANGLDGVLISSAATNNTIGGASAGTANVISGNLGSGVEITLAATTGNQVLGNKIGTNALGTNAIGNAIDGVRLRASGNLIGGDAAGAGNVISGNGRSGVTIEDAGSNNTVKGNLIGRAADGKSALGNTGDGVLIKTGAANNTIGGTAATSKNVISASHGSGVHLTDSGTTGNVIQGNEIGDALGAVALANLLDGVRFENGAAINLLGGTGAGAGNIIAFNAGYGVRVGSASGDGATIGDAILGNSIFSNGSGGIVLTGFPGNTPGSPHTGHPNNFQNTPVISQVTSNSTTTTIQVSINTNPTTTVHFEFFSNPSGSQGKTYLGSVDKMTNASGNATFTFNTASRLAPGVIVTATATVAGSTSQFSPTATVVQISDDVTAAVTVTRSGFLYNRSTKRFIQTLKVSNNSGHALSGPISLVFDNLSAGVSLFTPTGTTSALNPPANSPYIDFVPLAGTLANGATASAQVQFVDPTQAPISYTNRVLAGPGTR